LRPSAIDAATNENAAPSKSEPRCSESCNSSNASGNSA
jgi:hypothetical protein